MQECTKRYVKHHIYQEAGAEMRARRVRVEPRPVGDAPCVCSPGEEDASNALLSCASLTATRRRMPSQPSKSDLVLSTYWSSPPHYTVQAEQ